MNSADRKEAEVRRMLDLPHPVVPADLVLRAAERGTRLLNRRRTAHRVLWILLVAAVIVFTVWASATDPWSAPPTETTPPLEGW
ncbi:hypothetical protein ACFVWX_27985 [Streptomyces sp. NPDC058220]|uniref:hypothetical protein n=1 Tax=unclassified Streptomyces TaxID=2593676 RepID=UPI0036698C12